MKKIAVYLGIKMKYNLAALGDIPRTLEGRTTRDILGKFSKHASVTEDDHSLNSKGVVIFIDVCFILSVLLQIVSFNCLPCSRPMFLKINVFCRLFKGSVY